MRAAIERLRSYGIQATPQRIAIARVVLGARSHPSAEEVLRAVRRSNPTVSRATVYNTLNLFVEKGLLRAQQIHGATLSFDPIVRPHHHIIDEATGVVYDVPWDAVRVTGHESIRGFEVYDHQVIMHGRRTA